MSRRSITWRKKRGYPGEEPHAGVKHYRKASQCGGDKGKLASCMPHRTVKSEGRMQLRTPIHDRDTDEIIGMDLHPGRATGKVGTRAMDPEKVDRVLAKL
jgi:hypothetical protein